jgi:hypothetical protein
MLLLESGGTAWIDRENPARKGLPIVAVGFGPREQEKASRRAKYLPAERRRI